MLFRFKCPFCASENAVECTMNLRGGIGSLNCRLCAASFQMPIHHLHEPIDVFSEWLDACETAERSQEVDTDVRQLHRISGETHGKGLHDDDDDDDKLGESSVFAKKPKAISNDHGAKGNKQSESRSRSSYATLGLDDSDDDED